MASWFRGTALLGLSCLLSWATPAGAQTTVAADRFVDSVGVNLHLHYDRTIYRDNFDLVKDRLVELRVRHARDGLIDTTWQPYYDRHNALGAIGIRTIFITSTGQSSALLEQYPSLVSSAFAAYEAPNEYDRSNDRNWVQSLRDTLTRLRALRNNPALAMYPVYGPSLTQPSAFAALGDVSSVIDVGNLHNYFGGRHPGTPGWGANGYGSIDWNLALLQQYSGGKPVVSTETGYWNEQPTEGAVPQSVAGKYMPRLLLEQFRKGIIRTYIYELADFSQQPSGLTSSYGLLNRDGSPKPAFNALKGLLTLLDDPGPTHPVLPLAYSVSGASGDLHHMAFQKRDGTYYVAVWVEAESFDVNTLRTAAVAAQEVTVSVPATHRLVSTHRWQPDGTVSRTPAPSGTTVMRMAVSDTLSVLEFRSIVPPPSAPLNVRLSQ